MNLDIPYKHTLFNILNMQTTALWQNSTSIEVD